MLVSCCSHVLLLSILLKTEKRVVGFVEIQNIVERFWEYTWGIFQAITEVLSSRVRF